MKFKINYILIFLINILIISNMVFSEINNDTTVYENLYFDEFTIKREAIKLGVSSFIDNKGFKLYLNLELYLDKNILVYGNYLDALKYGSNNFKSVLNGYYRNNNYIGEYRYHGFTVDGNIYNSNDFPRDSDSGRSVSQKKWIYRYWEEIDENPSLITRYVTEFTNNPKVILTRKQVDKVINDVLAHSTNDLALMSSNGDGYSVADHMNLYQLNDTRFNGEGKMMQRNGNHLWYQQFSTNKSNGKEAVFQECLVEVLNKGSYSFINKDTAKISVKVTGIFEDKDLTTEVDKFTYYNIHDIKEYILKLNIGTKYKTIVGLPSAIYNGNSSYSYIFNMEVSESDLKEGVLKASGESYVVYYDKSVSNIGKDIDTDSLTGGLTSIFTVDDIMGDLTLKSIKYLDSSIGEIISYDIIIKNLNSGKEKICFYGSDSSKFCNDLYNYLKKEKFLSSYMVTQTVYNSIGEFHTSSDNFGIKKKIKEFIDLEFNIPEYVIDIDFVNVSDKTNYSIGYKSRNIYINGNLIDYNAFLNGDFSFGPCKNDYLANIEIVVISNDNVKSIRKTFIYVYSSLPRVSLSLLGTNKVNRKLLLKNTSQSINNSVVISKYPLTYSISYSGVTSNISNLKKLKINELSSNLLFKKEGFYKISIVAKSTSGRVSDVYDLNIGIVPDYKPNVIFNIWNNVLTRNEFLDISYEANSLDGDIISLNNFKIFFDINKDNSFSKIVYESKDEVVFSPTKLGKYKIVNYLEESFGEETIDRYITNSDKVSKVVERIFYVDNLRPLSEIDLEIPENFTKVDLYIIGDKNLNENTIKTLRENRIDYNNDLRLYGLDVLVEFRNLKYYTESQHITISKFFDQNYPDSSLSHSINGFSGVLDISTVINNPIEVKRYRSISYEECDTVNIFKEWVNCDYNCLHSCLSVGSACILPYESCCEAYYDAITTCTTKYRKVPYYTDIDQYTGYYSGDIKKIYRQAFSNPFRELSDKYIVYVVDSNGFDLVDYKKLKEKASFTPIIIGSNDVKNNFKDEIFILNDGSDINELMKKAIKEIGLRYPYSSSYLLELGESFDINEIEFDTEGDKIVTHGFQYIQEEIFDNSLGVETFSRIKYSDEISNFIKFKPSFFNKVGKFNIYKLISDKTGEHKFDKRSNLGKVSVIVHRKPIANYSLDWTYRPETNNFDVLFLDKSYDLDHEFSHIKKGIIDYKIMYRIKGGTWIYSIPKFLPIGKYELRYSVKDLEGAWSNTKESEFELFKKISPQIITASLKSLDIKFNLNSMPITEKLILYNIKTRFPYEEALEFSIINHKGNIVYLSKKKYDANNAISLDQDLLWKDNILAIPSSLYDGNYTIRVKAYDVNDYSNNVYKDFNIKIFTPGHLEGLIDNELKTAMKYKIKASTSKYVNEVDLVLFNNTINKVRYSMKRLTPYEWESTIVLDESLLDGSYECVFEAIINTTPKKIIKDIKVFNLISMKAKKISIKGAWNYWRGQVDLFGYKTTIEPHRFLSLEKIYIDIETIGNPDSVLIEMSSELESMLYVDSDGNKYYYKELIGYKVNFPISMSKNGDKFHYEYILPLANSTKSVANKKLKNPYFIKIILLKGNNRMEYIIDDINITGNTVDHVYKQPSK